jgi:hypothetical protein
LKLSNHQIGALKKVSITGQAQHWPEFRSVTIIKLNELGLTRWLNRINPDDVTYGLTSKGRKFIERHRELFK